MATKQHPLNSMHTAGIFSDMSIDGPEIGTLVMVVDKAKNLPNRKAMRKQDPYCAARLGKEAKKTTTDVRGGQTPKWDQELRFTVHDCPDYYQLKVSVFNDDKKTELIGETWIDLRDIVVSGGGQSDGWYNLNFRSKYAGEIRLEITYYDSRPKPEKAAARARAVASEADLSATAGQQAGSVPKRRPLPTEPPNGPAPAVAAPTPASGPLSSSSQAQEHVQTPPRPQPHTPTSYLPKHSPLQAVEYNTPSPSARQLHQRSHQNTPTHRADAPLPPNHHQHQQQQHRALERHDKYPVHPEEADIGPDDHSQYSNPHSNASPPFDPHEPRSSFDDGHDHQQQHYDGRGMSSLETNRHMSLGEDRPPPPPAHRSRGSSATAVSFDTGVKGTPLTMRQDVLRSEAHRQSTSGGVYPGRPTYRPYDSAPPPAGVAQYQDDELHLPSPPRHHSYDSASYDRHHKSMQPTVEDDPDSPSPLMTNSFRKSGSRVGQPNYDSPGHGFEPGNVPAPLNLGGGRNSYGSAHNSPAAVGSQQNHPQYHSNGLSQSVSPGPSRDVFTTSPDPVSSRDMYHTSPGPVSPMDHYYQTSPEPHSSRDQYSYSHHHTIPEPEMGPLRDQFQTSPGPNSYPAYTTPTHRQIEYRKELEDTHVQRSPNYAVPPVPPSLVPGVDHSLALELSSRINEDRRNERRYTSSGVVSTPTRGRQLLDYHNGSPQQFSTPPQQSFDRSHGSYSNGPSPSPAARPRGLSPSPGPGPQPQHTIRRKSVSPAPPAAEERRLSSVPFGPDSFDELNPTVAAVVAPKDHTTRPDYNEASGKIISHDGREIDPSDHLPMETWAPEPEPKKPKNPPPQQQGHSPGGGSLPIGASGRRQLRIAAARPQGSSPVTYSSGGGNASAPALTQYGEAAAAASSSPAPSSMNAIAAGRNRLQKKANRVSAMPVMSGANGAGSGSPGGGDGAVGSSPLAPLPQPHRQDNYTTPPRVLHRASTFDYNNSGNENHAPLVLYRGGGGSGGGDGGSPGDRRGSGGGMPGHYSAPPIPAKIPIGSSSYHHGGGGPGVPGMNGTGPARGQPHWVSGGGGDGSRGQGADLALLEEMQRIDIGTGRARRHGGY